MIALLLYRYAKRIEVKVNALNTREFPDKAGRIYPPLVVIEYEDIALDSSTEQSFDFTFKVSYDMEVSAVSLLCTCGRHK